MKFSSLTECAPFLSLNNSKVARYLMVILLIFLQGCMESDSKPDRAPRAKMSINENQSTENESKNIQYIAATKIPVTDQARQKLLKGISNETENNIEQQRLSLFTRFALLANSTRPELKTLQQIIHQLNILIEQRLSDVELSALLGSATSFKSIFYPEDSGKQRLLAKKGIRLMDRAVRQSPNHLGVRLQRGISYAEMPAFLGKARYAVEDLLLVKSATASNDLLFIAMIDFYLGKALINNRQVEQGIALLQPLVDKNQQPWSQQASNLINDKG